MICGYNTGIRICNVFGETKHHWYLLCFSNETKANILPLPCLYLAIIMVFEAMYYESLSHVDFNSYSKDFPVQVLLLDPVCAALWPQMIEDKQLLSNEPWGKGLVPYDQAGLFIPLIECSAKLSGKVKCFILISKPLVL